MRIIEGTPEEIVRYERLKMDEMEAQQDGVVVEDDVSLEEYLKDYLDSLEEVSKQKVVLRAIAESGDDGETLRELTNKISATDNEMKGVMGSIARYSIKFGWPKDAPLVKPSRNGDGDRFYTVDKCCRDIILGR